MIKFARNILTIEALNDIITIVRTSNSHHAEVAELADALDSKSSAFKRAGSSPAFGTTRSRAPQRVLLFFYDKRGQTPFVIKVMKHRLAYADF